MIKNQYWKKKVYDKKLCNPCDQIKEFTKFRQVGNKSKKFEKGHGFGAPDGSLRYSVCKSCEKKRMEERYKKNPIPQMLSNSKIRAKNKNVPHNITTKDINDICPKDNKCPVLNINFEMGYKNKKTKSYAPSLDRIEPKKGYVKGNILVVCDIVNRLKSDASIEDLRRISNFFINLKKN